MQSRQASGRAPQDDAPPGPDRSWLWAAGAPLVLLAVLLAHLSLRASSDLTPWKGGGFGMFSTIDSPATRLLRVELQGELGTTMVAVPGGLTSLADEVRAAPSEATVTDLANHLAGQLWVIPRMPTSGPSTPENDLIDQLAMQAVAQVAPVSTVQAVDPRTFDGNRQRKVGVDSVEVKVLRLTPADTGDGHETVTPVLIRSARVPAGTR